MKSNSTFIGAVHTKQEVAILHHWRPFRFRIRRKVAIRACCFSFLYIPAQNKQGLGWPLANCALNVFFQFQEDIPSGKTLPSQATQVEVGTALDERLPNIHGDSFDHRT